MSSIKCKATTKQGKQCEKNAYRNSNLCWLHALIYSMDDSIKKLKWYEQPRIQLLMGLLGFLIGLLGVFCTEYYGIKSDKSSGRIEEKFVKHEHESKEDANMIIYMLREQKEEFRKIARDNFQYCNNRIDRIMERIESIESPEAKKILAEFRKTGNLRDLQEYLIREGDKQEDRYVQGRLDIASVAFLRGDIKTANSALEEALKTDENNLYALLMHGQVLEHIGKLKEATSSYNRLLDLSRQTGDAKYTFYAMSAIGKLYAQTGNIEKAKEYFKDANDLANKSNDKELIQIAFSDNGNMYFIEGKYKDSLEMHKKSFELSCELKDPFAAINDLSNIGAVHLFLYDYDKAKGIIDTIINISEKFGLPYYQIRSYGNMALLYEDQNNLPKAEEYYDKARSVAEDINDVFNLRKVYSNLIILSKKKEDYSTALHLAEKSLGLSKSIGVLRYILEDMVCMSEIYYAQRNVPKSAETCSEIIKLDKNNENGDIVARAKGNLGLCLISLGRLDEAENLLLEAARYNEDNHIQDLLADNYSNLGVCYVVKHDLEKAETMCNKSLKINENLKRNEGLGDNYKGLWLIYKYRGDNKANEYWDKASEYYSALGQPEKMIEIKVLYEKTKQEYMLKN